MPTNVSFPRLLAAAASALLLLLSGSALASPSPDLVVSQLYGGGGNTGAPLRNDFIEIFNRGSVAVSLSGKSVQYTSATGTGNFAATPLPAVSLQPGQYFLVQESAGTVGDPLPTPDVSGTINMSATAGKVALVNQATALACNGGSTPCSPAQLALIIDLVGYGNANFFEGSDAPTLSNTTAAFRAGAGCTDTDNNGTDFSAAAPAPRNTSSATKDCNAATPTPPSASGTANPGSVNAGESTTLSVTVTPGANPNSTGLAVSGDLSSIGGSVAQPFADGGAGVFTFVATVAGSTSSGTKNLSITVTDAQGRSGSTSISLAVTAAVPRLAIHDIQGTGIFSPFAGMAVETEGIVTAIKTNGYFIQAPDAETDANSDTPEGIFVFTGTGRVPAAAAVGNRVRVRANVQDFIPASDPFSPPVTELSGTVTTTALSTGNSLPLVVNLSAANYQAGGSISQLAKYEGMRVHLDAIDIVAPSGGTISEPNASSTSTGAFYGVIPGTPRPFREAGIETPAPAPAGVPVFDANPERVRVDTGGQIGSVAVNVSTGDHAENLTGVLDFTFRSYTILTDPGTPPVVTSFDQHAIPVRAGAGEGELTVASFNMERFYDTTDDSGTSDVALSQAGFDRRLAKASLAIRNVLRMPDVIGVEEMEHLSTLQAVAARVDADAIKAGQTPPRYDAYLFEGNDIGGIDSGFLVKHDRVQVRTLPNGELDIQQIDTNPDGSTPFTYIQPDGTAALLNDRPPVVMRVLVNPVGKELPFAATIIVNHLRSLSGIEGTDGDRIRHKRLAQAEFLAKLIQDHQGAGEKVISVGDYNSFDVNDGYVDMVGIIRGVPAPAGQDVLAPDDKYVPPVPALVDLAPADPAQHYSYVFDGNAQVLDHIIVSQSLTVNEFTYARNDADFPEFLRNDPTRPERISDHDMPVAYFAVPRDTVAPAVVLSGVSEGAFYKLGAVPGASCTTTDDASGVRTPASLSITGGNADDTGFFTATCSGAVDNVGNAAADVVVHYAVDGHAPTVALNGIVDGAFYRVGAVPGISCVTTDDLSGVRTPAALQVLGGNLDGTGSFTAVCSGAVDNVGNASADVAVHYGVDGRAPTVTLTGVTEGAIYAPGAVPATICVTNDDASGVQTPAVLVVLGGSADGTGPFTATCTGAVDNVGNVAADVSVHYAVDGHPPVVALTGVIEGAVYRAGAVPAIACATADDLSGVRTPALLIITGGNSDGTGFFTATCTGAADNVGNVAADVTVHYAVDGMPPVVTLSGPAQGATYLLGTVPAASCTTVDDIAGVAAPASLVLSGGDANGLGTIKASCVGAVDNVGNVAPSVSVQYTVVGYDFGGFGPPAGGSITVARSGSTVPLKFQIHDWTGALITSTSVIAAIEYAPNPACSGTPATGWLPAVSANPLGVRFDSGAQGFTFQWKTTGIGEGCYSVAVRTTDTLRHSTLVQIRGGHQPF